MTDSEFRADLEELLKRHSGDLDADDLRGAAQALERQADKWEAISL